MRGWQLVRGLTVALLMVLASPGALDGCGKVAGS